MVCKVSDLFDQASKEDEEEEEKVNVYQLPFYSFVVFFVTQLTHAAISEGC